MHPIRTPALKNILAAIALGGVCFGAPVAPAAGADPTASDVTLKVSTQELILLEYHPDDPIFLPAEGLAGYEVPILRGGEVVARPGSPGLPVRRLVFGVPHGAAVELRVVKTASRPVGSYRILPAPRWEASEDRARMGIARYEEDPAIYTSDAPFPETPARIVLDSDFRGQRVVVVELAALRYRPSSGDLEFLAPMAVALELSGGTAARGVAGEDAHEAWFRNELVNYESARRWRTEGRSKGARQGSPGFQDGTDWFKLGITEKGIYRVTGAMLAEAGLNLSSVDPAEIRLFSGGGRPVPMALDTLRIWDDWMTECSIWVVDQGTAGRLDSEDEIIFYGLGSEGWAADYNGKVDEATLRPDSLWLRNIFTDTNFYWLTTRGSFAESPRRMAATQWGWNVPSVRREMSTPERLRLEENILENFEVEYEDGWMWMYFRNGLSDLFIHPSPVFEGVDTDRPARLKVRLTGQRKSGARHQATVFVNGDSIETVEWVSSYYADVDTFANLVDGANTIRIRVAEGSTTEPAEVALAWMEAEYWRFLRLGDQVPARSPDSTGIVEYVVELEDDRDVYVFDVTDQFSPGRIDSVFISGLSAAFRDSARADSISRYLVVSEWMSPAYVLRDETSDLRTNTASSEILIIHHSQFEEAALALAEHRQSADGGGWSTRLVDVGDVYDEFSWGLFDPAAIRDFLAYALYNYGNSIAESPGYVVLLGDASYNYRGQGTDTTPNYVPSWFVWHHRGGSYIYSTDDWFAYLSPEDSLMDMAMGRIPVQTGQQAEDVVNKIIAYDLSGSSGPWQSHLIMAADDLGKQCVFDPCEVFHTVDADSLLRYLPEEFTPKKIYLTEYSYGACLKRGAQRDFKAALDDGALITVYIGHGDRTKLADEELYVWPTTGAPSNSGRPTFFLAGSCEVGDFVEPTGASLGEHFLRQPDGGAVAVFSSTYLAYGSYNYRLLRALFSSLFPDRRFADQTVGGAVLQGKNQVRAAGLEGSQSLHNERLELLGDPAFRLAAPQLAVNLESIDGSPVEFVRRDTVAIRGTVMDAGSPRTDFIGTAWIEAYGTEDTTGHRVVNHLGQPLYTCPQSHIDYHLLGRPVYVGEVDVEAGEFESRFFIPWDAEEGALGRLAVFVSGGSVDGLGVIDSVGVGGMADSDDDEGPTFSISEGGMAVREGASLPPEGTLRICVEDESGINLQSASDTAAVVLVIDSAPPVDLRGSCQYLPGSYTLACAQCAYELDAGPHTLEVRAFDNMGNRTSWSFAVEVAPERGLEVRDVFCYPNPFEDGTYLIYELNRGADVTVRIFTVSGRSVRNLDVGSQLQGQQQVYWDGRDEDGDGVANGAYIYKVEARSGGTRASALGKAMRIR